MSEQLAPMQPVRLRIDVAYDGTEFSGWASQPGRRTVQAVLESAIDLQFGNRVPPVRLVVAGRTDAGVHASGQVAHVDLTPDHLAVCANRRDGATTPEGIAADVHRRLERVLIRNKDLFVTRIAPAPTGFDARFSAVWRRYRYRISDTRGTRNPLDRLRTHWHPRPLDLSALRAASEAALGLNDFLSFCKPRAGATTIRTLFDFEWSHDVDGVLVAELRADAFCHSMVRSLVGAVVAVGDGRRDVAEVEELIRAPRREQFAPGMPACGLNLIEVGYPDEAELAKRAELTRARRTLSVESVADPLL